MSSRDWYRKESWSEPDRLDFEHRLSRARPHSRAQYLRIQAFHLADSGHHRDALELLDRMLSEYPEPIELASAHLQRAQALDALDEVHAAVAAFRVAVAVEEAVPNVRTRVVVSFPLFVARRCLRSLFPEALRILDDPGMRQDFAIDRFEVAAARALIASATGDAEAARHLAKTALAAAEEQHSGLSRPPTIGLVVKREGLLDELRRLAC